jgi:hypothetical protein
MRLHDDPVTGGQRDWVTYPEIASTGFVISVRIRRGESRSWEDLVQFILKVIIRRREQRIGRLSIGKCASNFDVMRHARHAHRTRPLVNGPRVALAIRGDLLQSLLSVVDRDCRVA